MFVWSAYRMTAREIFKAVFFIVKMNWPERVSFICSFLSFFLSFFVVTS